MEQRKENRFSATEIVQCVKRFSVLLLGSLFVQIVIWAIYDFLKLNMLFCGISVIVTALLYHGIQLEKETGLSRKGVFFAVILLPFLMSAISAIFMLIQYPDISQTGGAVMLELISLYSARLVINGIVLLLFAFADSFYLRGRIKKTEQSDPS